MNRLTELLLKRKRENYSLSLDSALEKILVQLSQIPEVERVICSVHMLPAGAISSPIWISLS